MALLISHASAAEIKISAQTKKKNVTVFPFIPLDDSGKYKYYSSIIPKTLAKSMAKSELYDVSVAQEPFEILSPALKDAAQKSYFDKLKASVSPSTHYVITGFCELKENPQVMVNGRNEMLLTVKIQVINMLTEKFAMFDLTSREVGVILKKTIDDLQNNVDIKISAFEQENREMLKPSPYLASYKVLKRFSFGIEVGEFFILDDWADLYNCSEYIHPYFNISIINILGISINYEYFSTDNDDKDASAGSTMEINTAAAGLYFIYRFVSFMDVSAYASAGVSTTTIRFNKASEENSPFDKPRSKELSIDASIHTGASVGFHFFSAFLRLGCTYKRFFFSDKHLHGVAVYGSLGYSF